MKFVLACVGLAGFGALVNCTSAVPPSSDSGIVDAGNGPRLSTDDAGTVEVIDGGADFSEETQHCIEALDDLYESRVPIASDCDERDKVTCEQYLEDISFLTQQSHFCETDSDCTKMTSRVTCSGTTQVYSGGCKVPVAFATACAAVENRQQYLDFLCNDCGPPPECGTSVPVCIDGPPVCRFGVCRISAF